MTPLQRDFTYRLDAVKEVCESSGFQSNDCQYAIKIWNLQHNANVSVARMQNAFLDTTNILLIIFIGICIVSFLIGFFKKPPKP